MQLVEKLLSDSTTSLKIFNDNIAEALNSSLVVTNILLEHSCHADSNYGRKIDCLDIVKYKRPLCTPLKYQVGCFLQAITNKNIKLNFVIAPLGNNYLLTTEHIKNILPEKLMLKYNRRFIKSFDDFYSKAFGQLFFKLNNVDFDKIQFIESIATTWICISDNEDINYYCSTEVQEAIKYQIGTVAINVNVNDHYFNDRNVKLYWLPNNNHHKYELVTPDKELQFIKNDIDLYYLNKFKNSNFLA